MKRGVISYFAIGLLTLSLVYFRPCETLAQDDEADNFQISGYMQLQTGVFVPLASSGFKDHKNVAYKKFGKDNYDYDKPCDPMREPNTCYPLDHGGRAGDLSMARSTLQIDADYSPDPVANLHFVLRGVRSLRLEQDYWAQPPIPGAVDDRAQWVVDNIYNELDVRELYLDVYPTNWLSFRIGRQQVTWGETGQYRLLDVINPENSAWHFGPLESFQDTRTPLWIVKTLFEIHSISHDLELVWVPGIDRPEDYVSTPLTLVGAWGLPPSNTPSPFVIDEKRFVYPGGRLKDGRGGARWKGNLGERMTYSLVYYYTHQLSPPVPTYYDLYRIPPEEFPEGLDPNTILIDSNRMKTLYLEFPRQHIAGFSTEYTFDNPIGMVAKLEAAVEPDRRFPRNSGTPYKNVDESYGSGFERYYFDEAKELAASYAVVLMRPTMIRFLNPTQNFLLVFQWMHTIMPNLDDVDKQDVIVIPGFNDIKVTTHAYRIIGAIATNYMHGFLAPKIIGAYIAPESGFLTLSLGIRPDKNWRIALNVTDFYGSDPYNALGLFRDRDEVNLTVRVQF
ncbi:MAG: hypothetical protein Kow0090_02900 [Myxococcota bacterium]